MRRDFQSREANPFATRGRRVFLPLYGLQKLVTDLPPKPSYSLFDIDNLQQPGSVNQPNYTIVLE